MELRKGAACVQQSLHQFGYFTVRALLRLSLVPSPPPATSSPPNPALQVSALWLAPAVSARGLRNYVR